jgi:hypothetical protein
MLGQTLQEHVQFDSHLTTREALALHPPDLLLRGRVLRLSFPLVTRFLACVSLSLSFSHYETYGSTINLEGLFA